MAGKKKTSEVKVAKVKEVKKPNVTFDQVRALGVQPISLGATVLGTAIARTFETGSYGFGYSGPCLVQLPDGTAAECQASINIVVKHSKAAAALAAGETVEAPVVEEEVVEQAEAA